MKQYCVVYWREEEKINLCKKWFFVKKHANKFKDTLGDRFYDEE